MKYELADLKEYVDSGRAAAHAECRLREVEHGPVELIDEQHREAVRLRMAHRLAEMRLGLYDDPPHPATMRNIYAQIDAAKLWPCYQKRKNM